MDDSGSMVPAPRSSSQRIRSTVILALAAFGLLVFLWLANILSNHPDGWTGGAVEGWMGRGSWVGFLIVLLVAVVAVEAMLLEPVYARLRAPRIGAPGDQLMLGCPGCGTVFSLEATEIDDVFACRNCGRKGYIRDHNLSRTSIRVEMCRSCGHRYEEYQEYSECPACHTFNEY